MKLSIVFLKIKVGLAAFADEGWARVTIKRKLTPPHGDDNFQVVVLLQIHSGILTARHDFTVTLHGDALIPELHLF